MLQQQQLNEHQRCSCNQQHRRLPHRWCIEMSLSSSRSFILLLMMMMMMACVLMPWSTLFVESSSSSTRRSRMSPYRRHSSPTSYNRLPPHRRNDCNIEDRSSSTSSHINDWNDDNDDDDATTTTNTVTTTDDIDWMMDQEQNIQLIPARWIIDSSVRQQQQQQRSSSHVNDNDNGDNEYYCDATLVSTTTTETDIDTTIVADLIVTRFVQEEDVNIIIQPPQINIRDMTNVLLYTSTLNAQIQQVCRDCRTTATTTTATGSSRRAFVLQQQQYRSVVTSPLKTIPILNDRIDHLRGGGGGGSTVRTAMSYHIPYRIRNDASTTTTTSTTAEAVPSSTHTGGDVSMPNIDTAFCSNEPICHLQDFLSNVMQVLQIQQRNINKSDAYVVVDDAAMDDNDNDEMYQTSLERTLMMLYLDRACTTSSTSNIPYHSNVRLPFCTPATVHYLCVTAMLVATGAVRGDLLLLSSDNMSSSSIITAAQSPFMISLYERLETLMGIPAIDSQHRVSLMLQALKIGQRRGGGGGGVHSTMSNMDMDDDDDDDDDTGIFVSPSALQEWKDQWETRFTV